jgi:signal transduction histidine kinase
MIDIEAILIILILSSILLLGAFVFSKNSRSFTNRNFFYLTISISLWALFNFLENVNFDFGLRKTFLILDFALASVMSYFWLVYCANFLIESINLKIRKILILPPLVFFLLSFLGGIIIKNISLKEGAIYFDLGPLFILYGAFVFFYFAVGIYFLINKFRKFQGLYKLQTLYVLLGFILAAPITFAINVLFSQIATVSVSRIGIYAIFFIVLSDTYAILKYRLMDVRVIIRRSAVFTVLVLMITALYAVLSYLLSVFFTELIGISSVILNGVVMAVLVALGFEPLKTSLSLVTDKYLFKAEYNPQEVLSEFSESLTSTLDLGTISSFIVNRLGEVFKSKFISLFLLDEEEKQYYKVLDYGKVVAQMDKIDKKLFDKIFKYLQSIGKDREITVREELKKNNEILQNSTLKLLTDTLDKFEVNLIVPLYQRDKLMGILFLGDKKSGDVYSMQDLRILEIISGQSAVAMQNAQLFEEQKHFAEHLKKEVDKATKELQSANIQLKKLDRAKSEFISIASHQLRTPLTAIKGYISMMQQGDFGKLSEKLNQPLDRVFKSTDRIIHLVEDLLNISRLESGRMQYDFEKVDLADLVQEVYDELEQYGKKRGLDFTYQRPKEKLPLIEIDRNKIRETIMNLMDNAVKYTEKGFVKVSLEKLDGTVRFKVSDSGRGIAPDEMPMLFQKFSRASGVQLIHVEGTGLGLYIAKEILKKHKGKIWAESEGRGKGSSFIIDFKINNKLKK